MRMHTYVGLYSYMQLMDVTNFVLQVAKIIIFGC